MQLEKTDTVMKAFDDELQEMVESRYHEQQGEITESSSTGS